MKPRKPNQTRAFLRWFLKTFGSLTFLLIAVRIAVYAVNDVSGNIPMQELAGAVWSEMPVLLVLSLLLTLLLTVPIWMRARK